MSDQSVNVGTGATTITGETPPTPGSGVETPKPSDAAILSESSWMDTLPDDLKNEPTLQNFRGKDVSEVLKSYVSAQRMLGSSIRIPGPDASDDVKKEFMKKIENVQGVTRLPDPKDVEATNAFYAKLGVPKTANEYKIEVPQNIPVDPESVNQFKQLAHSLKLNNDQVAELVKYDSLRAEHAINQLNASRDTAVSTLKTTWGNEFDTRLKLANEATRHFESSYPDAVKELMNGPAGNNPVMLMMAAELGRVYRESGLIKGDTAVTGGHSPEEAKARIQEIRNNKAHPFHIKNQADPKHREAVNEMNKLYESAFPSKPDEKL